MIVKFIFALAFTLINFTSRVNEDNCNTYSIKIWDHNYSLAYTTYYRITDKFITIKRIGVLENEKDSILLNQPIRSEDCKLISHFFETHNINLLRNDYRTPGIQDGNRKRVVIKMNNKTKTIEVSNLYQREIGELFETINKLLSADFKIKYRAVVVNGIPFS